MDTFQELLKQCPQKIQELVKENSPFWDVYSRAVVEMKLDEDEQKKVHTEIMLVMVGLQKISDLHENIQNAGIPIEAVDVICDRILNKIPDEVIAILGDFEKQLDEEENPDEAEKKTEESTSKSDENAGIVYEKEEMPAEEIAETPGESKDDLINSIENPIPVKETPAETFLTNKLSGTITIPNTSVNTTLGQNKPVMPKEMKPEVKKYEKDPYREPLE